jgi:hypothetical protein
MNKLVVYSKSFWYNTNDGINFSKNANDGKRVVPINLFFFKKRIVSTPSAQTLSRQDPLDVGFGLSGDLSGLLASLQPTHSCCRQPRAAVALSYKETRPCDDDTRARYRVSAASVEELN